MLPTVRGLTTVGRLLLVGILLLLMGIGLLLMGIGRRLTTGRGPSVRRRRVVLRGIRVRHRASLHDGCGGAHSLAFKTIPVERPTRDSDDRQEKLDDRMKSSSPHRANRPTQPHKSPTKPPPRAPGPARPPLRAHRPA